MTSPEQVLAKLMEAGTDPLQKRNTLAVDFVQTVRHDTYDFVNPTQFDLSGRTVFITGASKGVGKAFAASYAKAGASNIILGARSSLEAAKLAGRPAPTILTLSLDVTDSKSVEKAAREVKQAFGGVDIVFWKTFEVNVKGPYLIARSFIPLLLSHKTKDPLKTLVNIGSIWGLTAMPENPAYQISKCTLMRLTELLTSNFPPTASDGEEDDGLLTYTVQPGSVMTELAGNLPEFIKVFLRDTSQLPGDTSIWLTAKERLSERSCYINGSLDMQELEAKKEEIVGDDLLRSKLNVRGEEMTMAASQRYGILATD